MRLKDDIKFSKIYNATLQQTAELGLAGITMAGIAKAAGIATGSLYTYYAGKAELIHEIYRQTLKVYGEKMFGDIAPELPVKPAIKKVFSNYLHFLKEHHNEWLFQDQYLTSIYAIDNKDTEASTMQMLTPLRHILKRGKEELLIKNITDNYFMALLLGFGHELTISVKIGAQSFDKTLVETGFNLYWDAIKS